MADNDDTADDTAPDERQAAEPVAVARSEEVVWPRFHRVEVDGEPVLLSRTQDGTAVAFGTICPHKHLPLDEGSLWEDEVDCPHHHYTYDPHTGRNLYPRRVFPSVKAAEIEGLPTYDVREAGGWVYIGERFEPPVG